MAADDQLISFEESGSDFSSRKNTHVVLASLNHAMNERHLFKNKQNAGETGISMQAAALQVVHCPTPPETLFCILPSTSCRIVSRQRDDNVPLFGMLRDNLSARPLDILLFFLSCDPHRARAQLKKGRFLLIMQRQPPPPLRDNP
jgi:hypothetical protein